MTDSAYEAQLRQQLYEARQETVSLRAERARLEDEVGPLRQRLAEALLRAERAEAALAAPCMEPVRASNFGQPVGPCIVLGPHVEHQDSNGVRWALLAEGAL